MRIGAIWQAIPNAYYRAVEPLRAMERRGHEVIWPDKATGQGSIGRLANCDVVHAYRGMYQRDRPLLEGLIQRGVAFVYDNDDDLSAIPRASATFKKAGALYGQRNFTATVQVARRAHIFTTTNEYLAQRYRRAGIERVEVIPNALGHQVHRPRVDHQGIVVGWIGGAEHAADLSQVDVRTALERLLAEHRAVRVEAIGADLGLSQRYRHEAQVAFLQLPRRIGGFDVGIAPLADIPFNQARSDVKVREYAASGVPWLASPVGPYTALGEREGGLLVPDDRWFESLDRLVSGKRERKRLARNGRRWAQNETIDAYADRWEQVFTSAAHGS